jgi:hypothetical protein
MRVFLDLFLDLAYRGETGLKPSFIVAPLLLLLRLEIGKGTGLLLPLIVGGI